MEEADHSETLISTYTGVAFQKTVILILTTVKTLKFVPTLIWKKNYDYVTKCNGKKRRNLKRMISNATGFAT
jgi:hypothetical protein